MWKMNVQNKVGINDNWMVQAVQRVSPSTQNEVKTTFCDNYFFDPTPHAFPLFCNTSRQQKF